MTEVHRTSAPALTTPKRGAAA